MQLHSGNYTSENLLQVVSDVAGDVIPRYVGKRYKNIAFEHPEHVEDVERWASNRVFLSIDSKHCTFLPSKFNQVAYIASALRTQAHVTLAHLELNPLSLPDGPRAYSSYERRHEKVQKQIDALEQQLGRHATFSEIEEEVGEKLARYAAPNPLRYDFVSLDHPDLDQEETEEDFILWNEPDAI